MTKQWVQILHQNTLRWGYLMVGMTALVAGLTTATELKSGVKLEEQAQGSFYRLRYGLRGPLPPPEEIVILAIDDESLTQGEFYRTKPDEYPYLEPIEAWPWKREAYGQAINQLMAAGARAVAMDVLFNTPSSYGSQDDQALQTVLEQHDGRVVLATLYEIQDAPQGSVVRVPKLHFQTPNLVSGYVNYRESPNGKIHQLAYLYLQDIRKRFPQFLPEGLPSFDQATLQAAQIPYPPPQGTEILFHGPERTFNQTPFWHVLEPQNWDYHLREGTFRDKVVLIGATAETLQDIEWTPVGSMPGIEVHANAIATLLRGLFLKQAIPNPIWQGLFVFLGVGTSGLIVGTVLDIGQRRLLAALGVALVWGGAAYSAFIYGGLILPTAVPMTALASIGLSYLAYGALRDRLEQQRLHRTLERYVAPAVVEEILDKPEDFRVLLLGRRLQAAILFSDLRGFSQLALKRDAQDLVDQLNTYLNCMVAAITDHRGTIDKFIGDAIMAEFGSPTSEGDAVDVMNAVLAALQMRRSLVDLQTQWRASGEPVLFQGIGINFGEAIAGNIGSERRLEYTVIGDAVNIASRVEGLTKPLGADILITEAVYQLIRDQVEVIPMGEHVLAGRSGATVQVYSLVGLKGEDPALYHQVQADLRKHLGFP